MPRRFPNHDRVYNRLSYSANPIDYICEKIILPEEAKLNPVLYGLELELSSDYTVPEMIDKQEKLFFICKDDSSISGQGSNRYECVTVPMSMAAQKKYWAEWFNNIDYSKFDTSLDTTNGIHIHVSRDKFTDEHLRSFVWLFMNPMNKYFFSAFSERSFDSISHYTKFINPQGRNLYQIYKNIVGMTHTLSKYSVVNLTKQQTIEVRLFKGVVSFASLVKNLELVEAAYNFSLEFVDSPWSYVTLDNFLSYINNTPSNKYECLKAFLKTMNLHRAKSEAMIQNIILMYVTKKKSPEEILSKLNKNPAFVHSKAIMSQLNQMLNKTHFQWNTKKRIIEVIPVKKGRIHTLDGVFARRYTDKVKDKTFKQEFKQILSVPVDVPYSEDQILNNFDSSLDFEETF